MSRLELDHVVIAAADLDDAAQELKSRHGLASVEGGRHLDWGTANRIIPLGDAYLELIAVVDQVKAADSVPGRWVRSARDGQPLGWAVRTDDLDAVAARLGLTANEGSRMTPDGSVLRWRSAGLERSVDEPSLPFFIEWHPGTPFPGRAAISELRIARLELEGDAERLARWLGDHRLAIEVEDGAPAVARVVLAGPAGELVLGGS